MSNPNSEHLWGNTHDDCLSGLVYQLLELLLIFLREHCIKFIVVWTISCFSFEGLPDIVQTIIIRAVITELEVIIDTSCF